MPDYSKGVIYTIRCLNDPNVYVGSTIQKLSVRMGGHRSSYVQNKVLGLNKEIVKDINDWKIELHELYPCLTKQELVRREGEVIREIGTLNKCIAGRTKKEYDIENIDKRKQYWIKNADNIKKQRKEYRNDNVDKLKEVSKEYYIDNIDKIKEYLIKNDDKIKEYRKQYSIKNADKIKENRKKNNFKKKLEKAQTTTV